MLVLDYPRPLLATKESHRAVTIPPYHSGHLGFVPDSEVHIGLLAPFTQDGTHCEVLVTPYESGMPLGRITCTMLDQRGVVKKLVDAVSSLDVNILLVETSSIHHARYHQLNLLFNWGTSEFDPTEKSSFNDQQRYHLYRTNFPIDLRCYVLLFERIVRFCLEDLALDHIAGLHLPSLYIRPVTTPRLEPNFPVKIQRTLDIITPAVKRPKDFQGHVAVTIPDTLAHVLRQRLDVEADTPLEYLLISETEDRILRVFFPKPQNVERIVHVGIRHEDTPGAMSNLLTLVRIAGFNVLTGLLRQSDGISRMWEGLLQYDGVRKLEERKSPDVYRWVADRLAYAAREVGPGIRPRLKRYDLHVGPPRYPKSEGCQTGLLQALDQLELSSSTGPNDDEERAYVSRQMNEYQIESALKFETRQPERGREAAEDRKNSLHTAKRPHADRPHLLKLYDLVVAGEFARIRPKIFLSYPFSAKDKADRVQEKLERYFEFERYQEGDLKIIVEEVIRRIESCDYFIGIWDPDRPSTGTRKRRTAPKSGWRISAWLPFEYGIAKTAKKPTVLAHHNDLNNKVWNRISPEVAQPGYDDSEANAFEVSALHFIYRHCVQEWIPSQAEPAPGSNNVQAPPVTDRPLNPLPSPPGRGAASNKAKSRIRKKRKIR
jgi:hypothetical protein